MGIIPSPQAVATAPTWTAPDVSPHRLLDPHLRSLHDARPTIPAGLLSARALIQFSARTRPLATADRYDRAAIMAAACKAAAGIMERCGVSRREAMSSASRPLGRLPRPPTAPSSLRLRR